MPYYVHASGRRSAFSRRFLRGFVALLLLPLSFLSLGLAAGADIAVVVRPDSPVDDLTLAQTRKLLLGEQQFWNSKLRVTLLLRAPAARERDVVLRVIYRMNEAEFRQYWISKMFRAEAANGPKVVYSNEMATELVSALPGSVAFVDASQVPKGLKILKIDGKLPGQPGYPLK
jgi:ABC-type phosphate transport system substrate-binding protein